MNSTFNLIEDFQFALICFSCHVGPAAILYQNYMLKAVFQYYPNNFSVAFYPFLHVLSLGFSIVWNYFVKQATQTWIK